MELKVLQLIALFLLTLVTGIFWGPWFALHRSLKAFSVAELIHLVKTIAKNLALPMRILMPACILFMFLSIWFYPHIHTGGFYLTITAFVLIIIVLFITILVEVPIVNQIKGWTEEAVPPGWDKIRNRWVLFHVIRTFISLASFGTFVLSIF